MPLAFIATSSLSAESRPKATSTAIRNATGSAVGMKRERHQPGHLQQDSAGDAVNDEELRQARAPGT